MDETLERLLTADEEGRARVASARAEATARIGAAREQCRVRQVERTEARRRTLADQLQHIEGAADRTVSERRIARAQYAEARRQAAEPLLAEAADAYARIVREGAAPRRST